MAIALVLLAVVATLLAGVSRRGKDEQARCGAGFVARGARCLFDSGGAGGACPPPLAASPHGCDAPDVRVLVPEATLVLGPSDWEAEGRVAPRTVHAGPFRIDAFEVTRGRWAQATAVHTPPATDSPVGRHVSHVNDVNGTDASSAAEIPDAARAASGMTWGEAAAFCARAAPGGRLPTEDEWIVAALSGPTPPAP